MGWWSNFVKFITPLPKEVDEVAKAKVINKAVEDATVTLTSLDEAITQGKVIPNKPKVAIKPKRARTKKGTYVADDKSTSDVNEAWVGGNAPKKKAVKPKVKVVRVKKKK